MYCHTGGVVAVVLGVLLCHPCAGHVDITTGTNVISVSNVYGAVDSDTTTVVPASIFSWTNTVGIWSDAGNWTTETDVAAAPISTGAAGYILNFNRAGTYTATHDLNNGFLLNKLSFGGATVTLAGNSLAFTNSGAALPQINQNSAVPVMVNNNVVLGTNVIFGGTGNGPMTVVGVISGAGGLTKAGSGTLTLGGGGNATGGTITHSGGYTVHTFTSSGTFTPSGAMSVEVLVVGGGGAGGGRHGGGGAGGGLVYNAAYAVTPQGYTVTVGDGGQPSQTAPGTQSVGSNGQASVFATMTALGGGGGGSYSAAVPTGGGSGGGGGGGQNTAAGLKNQGNSGSGTGYGNNGGTGGTTTGGGGGGGAGAVGSNAAEADSGGNGGVGLAYALSGSSVYYAGGGGGGGNTAGGTGGTGGGGDGGIDTGTAGIANTGGGGGGVRSATTTVQGKAGGSGIVIVRYLTASTSIHTYRGATLVSAGTLALGSGSSLTNTPVIGIAGGATYDVSAADAARAGAGALGSGQTLQAGGSTNSGILATAAGHGLALGANSPLVFTAFKPSGSGGAVPLVLSGAGTLTLGSNTPVTITVSNGGTPLSAVGSPYKLVGKGTSGIVSNLPGGTLVVNGDGVIGDPSLLLTNGELYLQVSAGVVNLRPPNGSWTNALTVPLEWQLPSLVTETNWVSVRVNSTWFTPAAPTSTMAQLSLGTNTWQVAYTPPAGGGETSSAWVVGYDTGMPVAVLASPSNGAIMPTNAVSFKYLVWDVPEAGLAASSGVGRVELSYCQTNAPLFTTTLYSWVESTTTTNTFNVILPHPQTNIVTYGWYIRVWDRAGNVYATPTSTFTLAIPAYVFTTEHRTDNRLRPVINTFLPSAQWTFGFVSNQTIAAPWTASNIVGSVLSNRAVTAATMADMNGDGKLEVVCATADGTNCLLAQGLGTSATWTSAGGACSVAAGDFNNDGLLDLAMGFAGGSNLVLINHGGGTNFTAYPLGVGTRSTRMVGAGDMNADGRLDLVEVNGGAYRSYVYLNDGTGTNWAKAGKILGQNVDSTYAVIADFLGDGCDDVAIVSGTEWPNYLYVNDGTGTNFAPVLLNAGGLTRGVAAGDLNNDGLLDIAEVDAPGGVNNIGGVVYLADASRTNFVAFTNVLAAGDNGSCVAIRDMDMDGRADIVVGIDAMQPGALYLNDGTGTCMVRRTVEGVSNVQAIATGDWNGDGASDLLVLQTPASAVPLRNAVVDDGNAVVQAAYRLVVEDLGVPSGSQVWVSAMVSGVYHGVWNSGVLVSNLTHSGSYAWRVQCISSLQQTGIWSCANRFMYRMSNDYCEFHRMPDTIVAGFTSSSTVYTVDIRGIASTSIVSMVLTNVTSGAGLSLAPSTKWTVTNLPQSFLGDASNEVHVVGRTAAGRTASDDICILVTNRGIANIAPLNGLWTNVQPVLLVWQVPPFVMATNRVSVRVNGTWFTPTTPTSTMAQLSLGSNMWQAAYRTPEGIAETSDEWVVGSDTGRPMARLLYPAKDSVLSRSSVEFGYSVFDPAQAGAAASSGVDRVELRCYASSTLVFATSLFTWAESATATNTFSCPLPDGTNYAWGLRVWDRAGNGYVTGTNAFTVSADTPVLFSPGNMAWVNTVSNVFEWNLPETLPASVAEIQINNNPWLVADTLTSAYQAIVPGTNTWRVRLGSLSGDYRTSVTWRVLLDMVPPTGILMNPASNWYVLPGTVVFDYQVADTNSPWRSGVASVRFHFVAPGTSYWTGIAEFSSVPATNRYATLPYNPLTGQAEPIYGWQLEMADRAGNVATTELASFGIDGTPPYLKITGPFGGANFITNTTGFDFTGIATDFYASALNTLSWNNLSRGGAGSKAATEAWSIRATNAFLQNGTNALSFAVWDKVGYSATATVTAIIDLTPPDLRFTSPLSGGTFLCTQGDASYLQGTADDLSSIAWLAWSNIDQAVGGVLPASKVWAVSAGDMNLTYGITNTIRIYAADAFGWQTNADVKVQLVAGEAESNTLPVMANWPAQLGLTQTGFVEFVSTTNEEYLLLLDQATGAVVLTSWRATGVYSLISFSLAGQSGAAGDAPPLRLYSRSSGSWTYMPRPFILVDDMPVVLDGKTASTDTDGDLIYFTLKPLGAAHADVQGRSISISGMTEPATLTIKVKATGGDGKTILPFIACDGSLKALKATKCSIDEIHLTGSVVSVSMSKGTLGYRHDRRAQVCHGLACYGPSGETGLKQVTADSLLGQVRAPVSYKQKGASILAAKTGVLQGVFVCDLYKTVRGGTIDDAWMFATTTNGKGLGFKSISADTFMDSNMATNGPLANAQTLFVAGMPPAVFWPQVAATNEFLGIIPSGYIGSMLSQSYFANPQATFVIGKPQRPIKIKTNVFPPSFVGYWFVNGERKPGNWNGKD